jgi:O-antigen/teichoic acid export membrane protein
MKGIILMPIIIKTVGVTIYGGFALLSSILGIIFGVSSFGTGFKAKRFLPSTENMLDRRNLFYPQFFFGLSSTILFSVFLLVFEEVINKYLFKNEIEYASLIISVFMVAYFLYSQGSDYFRYTSRVHYMTVVGIVFPYVHIVLILLTFYFFHFININVLFLSQAIAAIMIVIPCFWIILKEISIRFSFYTIKSLVSDIKLGFPMVITFILDFILGGSDRYFIALYLTVSDVGYYTPGYVLGSFIILLPKAMGGALPQLMSKAVDKKDEQEAHTMLNYAIRIFVLAAIPFVIGCIVLSGPILSLIANKEVALNARWISPVVALGMLFYGLNLILTNVLYVHLKMNNILKINFMTATFSLLSNAILFNYFGSIMVAAITNLLSYLLTFLFMSHLVREEKWSVDYQPLVIMKSISSGIIMGASLLVVSSISGGSQSIILLIGEVFLGISTYILFLFIFHTFTNKELSFLKSIIFRIGN